MLLLHVKKTARIKLTNISKNKATGQHFNEPGHSVSDMTITVIEKLVNKDPQYRKQREKMFINKFNTRNKGLNKMSGG